MNRAVLHNLESLVEGRRKREGGGKKKRKKKENVGARNAVKHAVQRSRLQRYDHRCTRVYTSKSIRAYVEERMARGISHAKQGKSPISIAGLRMRARVERVGFPTRGIIYFIFNRRSVFSLFSFSSWAIFAKSSRLKYGISTLPCWKKMDSHLIDWKDRVEANEEELRNAVAGKRSCSWLRSWFGRANPFLVAYSS